MNFGLVVLAWVLWIIGHGVNPNVPKTDDFYMIVAACFALSADGARTININSGNSEKK